MIDYGFEARLIDRIALRECIAAAHLDLRQKRVLRGYLCGQTFVEISRNEGRSIERVRQIFQQSVRKVRRRFLKASAGFDKTAFLDHMRHLAGQRSTAELANERASLERMMATEFTPRPPRPVQPPPKLPRHVSSALIEKLLLAGEFHQVWSYGQHNLVDLSDPALSDFARIILDMAKPRAPGP